MGYKKPDKVNDIVLKNNAALSSEIKRVSAEYEETVKLKNSIIEQLLKKYLSIKEENEAIKKAVQKSTQEIIQVCGLKTFKLLIDLDEMETISFDEDDKKTRHKTKVDLETKRLNEYSLSNFEDHTLEEWIEYVLKG